MSNVGLEREFGVKYDSKVTGFINPRDVDSIELELKRVLFISEEILMRVTTSEEHSHGFSWAQLKAS